MTYDRFASWESFYTNFPNHLIKSFMSKTAHLLRNQITTWAISNCKMFFPQCVCICRDLNEFYGFLLMIREFAVVMYYVLWPKKKTPISWNNAFTAFNFLCSYNELVNETVNIYVQIASNCMSMYFGRLKFLQTQTCRGMRRVGNILHI